MNFLYFQKQILLFLLLAIALSTSSQVIAVDKRYTVENKSIKMVIIPRTAHQMAAFYEGREFPDNAIQATRDACFFTVGIQNKTKDIIWLNTQQWQLGSTAAPVSLISKEQWKQRWKELNVPQRFQSTFRWTLLPKQLDFYPAEREGGNITILRQDHAFNLTADFATGADKQGKAIRVEFKNLRCAKDNKQ